MQFLTRRVSVSLNDEIAGADLIRVRRTLSSNSLHFKLGCLMYKSLSGQAPQYLADDVQLVADSGRRRLRSASDRTCVVPRTHNSFGDRSFSAAGPRVWNALPPELRHDISFGLFTRKLKSHLFV